MRSTVAAPWPQDYLGEKIALYFALLGHYTGWLAPFAAIALIMFADQLIEWKLDATLAPYFSVFVSFWAVSYVPDERDTARSDLWRTREGCQRFPSGDFSFVCFSCAVGLGRARCRGACATPAMVIGSERFIDSGEVFGVRKCGLYVAMVWGP